MQTFLITLVFGSLAIMFGICTIIPPIAGILNGKSFTVKWYHVVGFVFSAYMLAMEYSFVPNPFVR